MRDESARHRASVRAGDWYELHGQESIATHSARSRVALLLEGVQKTCPMQVRWNRWA